MRFVHVAALALASAAQAAPDLSTATPIAGSWSYRTTSDGSEASFANGSGAVQLSLHCTRATRRISISRPSGAAVPSVSLWTSGSARDIPASFNPTTGLLTLDLGFYDPILDGMANSRGRIGITVGTQPPLVVPAWPEIARVIEDCRA
jgi:hypothetical protein